MKKQIVALLAIVLTAGCDPAGGGAAAPEFEVRKLGASEKLTNVSFRGKVVLLEFWATWCGPCRETMPHLEKLHREYASKGLEVVAVSSEEESLVRTFAKNSGFTYPIYTDPLGVTNGAFGVGSIPHAVVLSRDGSVVFQGHPLDEGMDPAIERALG
jgi:thiol-disulfide isomerase/thioredoxin